MRWWCKNRDCGTAHQQLPRRTHNQDTMVLLETSLESPPGGLEEEYYWAIEYGGDVIEMSTGDWCLMLYSNLSVTGGQKHTHIPGRILLAVKFSLCLSVTFSCISRGGILPTYCSRHTTCADKFPMLHPCNLPFHLLLYDVPSILHILCGHIISNDVKGCVKGA